MANRMLRKLPGIMSLLAIFWLLPITASSQEQVKSYPIYIDDELVVFDSPPIVEDGYTLVEFRKIFEMLGYQVSWDEKTNTAYGFNNDLHIEFQIGEKEALVNGEVKELPVETRLVNGRTFIPLRFISEESGYDVTWDPAQESIFITREQVVDERLAIKSSITLNGFVELYGTVNDRVKYIRADISHMDTPDEVDQVYIDLGHEIVDSLIKLDYGPGLYTMRVYASTGDGRYSSYRLLETFKISYPEDPGLIIVPDDADPHRYTVKVRLSPEAEQAELKITKLDREAYMRMLFSDVESRELSEKIYLSFGPGVYLVELFEFSADGSQEVRSTTLTHDGNAEIRLDTHATDNSKVRLVGTVSPEMKWMWVQYANVSQSLMRTAFLPIVAGRVNQTLHLNMGEGQYQIKIGLTAQDYPYNKEYITYEIHEIENTDTRNVYLLPSELVQSEDRAIVELAESITADLETDQEKSKAIHDWVASHIALNAESYMTKPSLDVSAAEVHAERVSGSKGFARLNAALHRAVGIPAKVINGEVRIEDRWLRHSWNEVFIEDRWIMQDPLRNAGEVDIEEGSFKAKLTHEYYDPDISTFKANYQNAMDTRE